MIEFLLIILAIGVLILAVISTQQPRSRSRGGKRSGRVGHIDREFVAGKWSEIQSKANGGALASSVSDADKLLDYALKHSGARGETMGERLKDSRGRFSDLNSIWRAHKLRNALAHESDFDLVPSQAKEAISDFERGLKDLGAL